MRHGMYCDPEPGGLARAVERASDDNESCEPMAVGLASLCCAFTPGVLVDRGIECGPAAQKG
jgi:hypothetical protein